MKYAIIIIVIVLVIGAVLLIRHLQFVNDPVFKECHFTWIPECITIDIDALEFDGRKVSRLNFNQDVGVDAWATLRLRIPASWVIEEHTWSGTTLEITLSDGDKYFISPSNFGDLSGIGHKTEMWGFVPDEELKASWDKLGTKEEAEKIFDEPVNTTLEEWEQMRLNVYGEELLELLNQPDAE